MFTFNYTIKQEDLNYGNHVGNERALLFFQWAREEFLRIIFEHEIFCGEDLAITGTATVLAYNYKEQKVKKVPTSFKELVENY